MLQMGDKNTSWAGVIHAEIKIFQEKYQEGNIFLCFCRDITFLSHYDIKQIVEGPITEKI